MESWTAGGVVVNTELLKGQALSYWWMSVFLPSPVDTNSGAKERGRGYKQSNAFPLQGV